MGSNSCLGCGAVVSCDMTRCWPCHFAEYPDRWAPSAGYPCASCTASYGNSYHRSNCPLSPDLPLRPGTTAPAAPAADEFKKHDSGKPDLSLVPPHFLMELGKCLTKGEEKYGRANYLKGAKWHRYLAACLRHLMEWAMGKEIDDGPGGTGCSHLINAVACLVILFESQRMKVGTDDRKEVTG